MGGRWMGKEGLMEGKGGLRDQKGDNGWERG